jgi:Rps23 Pro-64 3,4-dihydroxylase Tpa1-like proline 4-hydroxylase
VNELRPSINDKSSGVLDDPLAGVVSMNPPERDHVMVHGRRLNLDELFALNITSAELLAAQRASFRHGKPFEHIVIDGLFNEQLLSLIEEEFPPPNASGWRKFSGRYESTYRSKSAARLGPAAQIYFNLVNSNAFVCYLSAVTGISDLITDHTLLGGGLHETRAGDWFAVHRDFNFHHNTMLANTLVFLTYLNRDWRPEYGGALELWDGELNRKIAGVAPVFGRSILFRHSDKSFHGHPTPLTPPLGRSRRSLGSYYYVNDLANYRRLSWSSSLFLDELGNSKRSAWTRARNKLAQLRAMDGSGRFKYLARGLTPPLLWWAARSFYNVVQRN